MKVYNRRRGLEMGGLMRIRKSNAKHLSDSSVNHKQKKSLIAQVEQDHLGDSFIYRVRSNIANMLHIGRSRRTRHAGSVVRVLVIALVMLLTLSQAGPFFADLSGVHAETAINRWGTVTGNSVNLRPQATSVNPALDTLYLNARVNVISQVTGQATTSYGDQWYKVKYTKANGQTIEGYMVASLIRLDPDVPADDPFYQELKNKGFPASYWPALRELKIKYPAWTFTPLMIDAKYDWNTIIRNQDVAGRNLLPAIWYNYLSTRYGLVQSEYNALKSYSSASFNYYINDSSKKLVPDTWITYDNDDWVMVNQATIAYYLDPRNWLHEGSIFMFENLEYNPSVHTREGVSQILAGSFMDGRERYDIQKYDAANVPQGGIVNGTQLDFFMEAAERSNVSPYHLATRSRQEVGNKSQSVTGTYIDPDGLLDLRNLYNYYNIGATQTGINVRNGLEYALYGPGRKPEQTETDNRYLIPWNSPWRSIVGGAVFIGSEYISAKQHTLYLQKFDLIDDSKNGVFWHQYMGNILAPYGEAMETYEAYKEMNQLGNNFEFLIPVIAGMPETPAQLPTDARNRNPYIGAIDVSGLALNQAFNPGKTEYSVTLNHEIEAVTITASTINSKASATGTGTYSVMPGTNIISITGVAEAGETRTYTISIIRKAADGTIPPDVYRPQNPTVPALSFSQQLIKVQSNVMTGLDPAQNLNTVEQFVSNLGITAGYQVQVLRADGAPQTGLIGTGNIIRISYENLVSQDYQIVIYGDIDGDGRISSADLNHVYNHVLKVAEVAGISASAADIDKDGRISSADLNHVYNHVLKVSNITQ